MIIKRDRYLKLLIDNKKNGILYIGVEDFLLNYINQME